MQPHPHHVRTRLTIVKSGVSSHLFCRSTAACSCAPAALSHPNVGRAEILEGFGTSSLRRPPCQALFAHPRVSRRRGVSPARTKMPTTPMFSTRVGERSHPQTAEAAKRHAAFATFLLSAYLYSGLSSVIQSNSNRYHNPEQTFSTISTATPTAIINRGFL